jgi:hypothetical protein
MLQHILAIWNKKCKRSYEDKAVEALLRMMPGDYNQIAM